MATAHAVPNNPVTVEVCWDKNWSALREVVQGPPLARLAGGCRLQVCQNLPTENPTHANTIVNHQWTDWTAFSRIGLSIGEVGYYYAQLFANVIQEDSSGDIMYEEDGTTPIFYEYGLGWQRIYVGTVNQTALNNYLYGLFDIAPRNDQYASDTAVWAMSELLQLDFDPNNTPYEFYYSWPIADPKQYHVSRVHPTILVGGKDVQVLEPWVTMLSSSTKMRTPKLGPQWSWKTTMIPIQFELILMSSITL